jgi:MipA family protein
MRFALPLSALLASVALPAAAQEEPAEPRTRTVLLGGVINWKPAFPGADNRSRGFFPLIAVWNEGEPMPAETPDESFGINFIGDDEGVSAGVALTASPRRRARDTGIALDTVGFGLEAGGFAQAWIGDTVRLRAEVRQGIGGHEALTSDLAADLVIRTPNDNVMLTAGPRLRWGSGGYTRTYFGVSTTEALATGLSPYRPDSGIYAYGGVASAHVHITDAIGLYTYGGYERLTGDAARSPIVRSIGNRNQLSVGIGLSYRFSVDRGPPPSRQ